MTDEAAEILAAAGRASEKACGVEAGARPITARHDNGTRQPRRVDVRGWELSMEIIRTNTGNREVR